MIWSIIWTLILVFGEVIYVILKYIKRYEKGGDDADEGWQ